jgi:hypothetical protein
MEALMPRLLKPEYEAFARARVQGFTQRQSHQRAGFAGKSGRYGYDVDHISQVAARVAELKALALGADAAEALPMIDRLMTLAGKAAELGTASGLNAAKGLLAEAARLKRELNAQSERDDDYDDIPPRISQEEWMKIYAPQS